MQAIIDKIQEKTAINKDYWDYKDKKGLESYALSELMKYPAMMVSDSAYNL